MNRPLEQTNDHMDETDARLQAIDVLLRKSTLCRAEIERMLATLPEDAIGQLLRLDAHPQSADLVQQIARQYRDSQRPAPRAAEEPTPPARRRK